MNDGWQLGITVVVCRKNIQQVCNFKTFRGLFSALETIHSALCITKAQLYRMEVTDIKVPNYFTATLSSSHALPVSYILSVWHTASVKPQSPHSMHGTQVKPGACSAQVE